MLARIISVKMEERVLYKTTIPNATALRVSLEFIAKIKVYTNNNK